MSLTYATSGESKSDSANEKRGGNTTKLNPSLALAQRHPAPVECMTAMIGLISQIRNITIKVEKRIGAAAAGKTGKATCTGQQLVYEYAQAIGLALPAGVGALPQGPHQFSITHPCL